MNIFISPKQAARQTEDRVYTQEKEVHNNKITKMHTNIKHSPERLSNVANAQMIGTCIKY